MVFDDYDVLIIREISEASRQRLHSLFRVHDAIDRAKLPRVLQEVAGSIRAIVTGGARGADATLMDELPRLELISCVSAGIDGIDLKHARSRGILVTNTSRALIDDVADTAIALMLMVTRRFAAADRFVRAGRWPVDGEFPLSRSVAGKTMGILGLGSIGLGIARRAEAMGMRIAYSNRRPRTDVAYRYERDLRRLAALSDVLVVSCPGGAETCNLIGTDTLAELGPDGCLVNIARGSVLDEPALVRALQQRMIAGAGLDVYAQEPRVPSELIALDNVVLLPHVGSGTEETREAMFRLAVDNLIEHCEGRPVLTPL